MLRQFISLIIIGYSQGTTQRQPLFLLPTLHMISMSSCVDLLTRWKDKDKKLLTFSTYNSHLSCGQKKKYRGRKFSTFATEGFGTYLKQDKKGTKSASISLACLQVFIQNLGTTRQTPMFSVLVFFFNFAPQKR